MPEREGCLEDNAHVQWCRRRRGALGNSRTRVFSAEAEMWAREEFCDDMKCQVEYYPCQVLILGMFYMCIFSM